MGRALILKDFRNSVVANGAGGINVSAGRFSRGAIVAAFELNGGLETFADWAKENPTDFYTRMFGRIIGKEALEPTKGPDDVEDLLETIEDAEYEDITDSVEARSPIRDVSVGSDMKELLAKVAAAYSEGESEEV